MGVFGTGGLHKPTTWLPPVATFAQLPVVAIDGATVLIRDSDEVYSYDAATATWKKLAPSSGVFSTYADYTPTLGQTVFVLPSPPTSPSDIRMEVNHVVYYPPVSFTVGGPNNQTITWNNAFILDPVDSVRIYF